MGASKIVNKAKCGLKSMDAFGVDVGTTYEGSSKFRTVLGGIITLIIYVLLIVYLIITLHEAIKTRDEEITTTTTTTCDGSTNGNVTVTNITEVIYSNGEISWTQEKSTKLTTQNTRATSELSDMVYPFQTGLGIAVKLSIGSDPRIAFLEFYLQSRSETDENPEYHLLDSELCSETTFPYHNWTEAEEFGLDEYYCLSNNNTALTKYSTNYVMSNLRVFISLCQNTTQCRNNSAIEEAVYGAEAYVRIIDSYLDPDDETDPIKTFINSDYRIFLAYGYWSDTSIALRPNLYRHSNGSVTEFYTPRTKYYSQSVYNSYYLGGINFPIDSLTDVHQAYTYYEPYVSERRNLETCEETNNRRVESIYSISKPIAVLDSIAKSGGMYIVLIAILSIAMNYLNKRQFMKEIVQKLEKYESDLANSKKRINGQNMINRVAPMSPEEEEKLNQSNAELVNNDNAPLYGMPFDVQYSASRFMTSSRNLKNAYNEFNTNRDIVSIVGTQNVLKAQLNSNRSRSEPRPNSTVSVASNSKGHPATNDRTSQENMPASGPPIIFSGINPVINAPIAPTEALRTPALNPAVKSRIKSINKIVDHEVRSTGAPYQKTPDDINNKELWYMNSQDLIANNILVESSDPSDEKESEDNKEENVDEEER